MPTRAEWPEIAAGIEPSPLRQPLQNARHLAAVQPSGTHHTGFVHRPKDRACGNAGRLQPAAQLTDGLPPQPANLASAGLVRLAPPDERRGGAIRGKRQVRDFERHDLAAARQHVPHRQKQGDIAAFRQGHPGGVEDPGDLSLAKRRRLSLPGAKGSGHALEREPDHLRLGRISQRRGSVQGGDRPDRLANGGGLPAQPSQRIHVDRQGLGRGGEGREALRCRPAAEGGGGLAQAPARSPAPGHHGLGAHAHPAGRQCPR